MHEPDVHEELENWRLAARRFEALFQRLPVPCIGYDLQGTIFEWNRACEDCLGQAAALLFMRSIQNLFCFEEDQREAMDRMLEQIAAGESVDHRPWSMMMTDGSIRHILLNMIPTIGPGGTIGGGILAWTDITALKEYEHQIEQQLTQIHEYSAQIELRTQELEDANARLSTLAWTDGLTGLANRRSFQEALRRSIALTTPGRLSLILIDVDHFKAYNDTYGHPQGDLVLKGVADCLRECTECTDGMPARYGGEEFVVLLPVSGAKEAKRVAETLRKRIAERDFPCAPVTASFGVATFGHGCGDAEALIELADKALYESKSRGRNRVTHADALDRFAA